MEEGEKSPPTVRSVLIEYDLPVEVRATCRAELTRPDNTSKTLTMSEFELGVFEATTPTLLPHRYLPLSHRCRGADSTGKSLLTRADADRGRMEGERQPSTDVEGRRSFLSSYQPFASSGEYSSCIAESGHQSGCVAVMPGGVLPKVFTRSVTLIDAPYARRPASSDHPR